MKRPTRPFYDLGRRLLAQEAEGRAASADLSTAVEAVFQKLQARLAVLLGKAGFQSVLARALHLAQTEQPLLKAVEVEPAPNNPAAGIPLKGLRESVAGGDAGAVATALTTLIGSFIWLLAALVGEDLVRRELRRIWPALSFPEAGSGSEEAKK